MKIAVIADVHLSRYGQDRVEETSNLPERLHGIKNALYNVAEYCINNDIVHIVIAGDLLHSKSVIYAIAQDLMFNYFEKYQKDLQFTVIDGNHDLASKGEDAISSLRSLENIDNVKWVSKNPFYLPSDIVFIPYSYNVVDQVKQNKGRILISHFGLNEGVLNSGISIVSDLSLGDLIGKYELVILGHYHKPQEIIREDIKLYYAGSPIQLDWGEKGDVKRFLVVDTDTLDVQSIPTAGYRQYIEYEITTENKDEVFKKAEVMKKAGHHIKIVKKEAVDLDDINEEYRIVDKTEQDITNRGISSSMSQADKLKRYLEIKEIPEKDMHNYEKVGLEIIDACEGENGY